MYNHYIPNGAERVPVDGPGPGPHRHPPPQGQHPHRQPQAGQPPQGGPRQSKLGGLLKGLLGQGGGESNQISQTLDRLLKGLHLEHLDTGDILLGLIVLFLVLEDGDDLDLIITLALTILLNLGEP